MKQRMVYIPGSQSLDFRTSIWSGSCSIQNLLRLRDCFCWSLHLIRWRLSLSPKCSETHVAWIASSSPAPALSQEGKAAAESGWAPALLSAVGHNWWSGLPD